MLTALIQLSLSLALRPALRRRVLPARTARTTARWRGRLECKQTGLLRYGWHRDERQAHASNALRVVMYDSTTSDIIVPFSNEAQRHGDGDIRNEGSYGLETFHSEPSPTMAISHIANQEPSDPSVAALHDIQQTLVVHCHPRCHVNAEEMVSLPAASLPLPSRPGAVEDKLNPSGRCLQMQ